MSEMLHLDAAAVADLVDMPDAIAAIRDALAAGLDPAADPPRAAAQTRFGELLTMPADWGDFAGVKVVSIAPDNPAAGRPRIQGVYLLLDAETLSPVASLDGAALTALRTPAVSAVAVAELATGGSSRLAVFGTGPQAAGHVEAMRAVRPIADVAVIGRDQRRVTAFAARLTGLTARIGSTADLPAADIVVCATTSATPLFEQGLVADHSVVVAVGSHQPGVVELDPALLGRSAVVVEDRATALREAGEIIAALKAGLLTADALVPLAELVRSPAGSAHSAPRVFKSVGMAWEDLVVAACAYRAAIQGGRR